MAVTYRDCLDGVCPCSRPEPPAPDHRCPSDGLTDEQREAEWEAQTYRPNLDEYRDQAELNRLEGITVQVRR